VFRATDTKLKRQVAIKILPHSLAADHDRLTRFQREAEVLASLNHPHIAGIYELEESEGVVALVMELVEGEELSQRIARGAIPIAEALLLAKQIAEALEAAHEQGIIHRDLKPANMKVRADGTVKVLDFGLAKAIEAGGAGQAGGAGNLSMSPTLSLHATMAGVILGTAAYMSPEQARGKAVDKRADIWAFGAVLFEMLTGRRAFPGEDVTDTIVSVVSKEPNWSALPTQTPPAIRRVLARCLKKDAKARMRDIGEARLEIEDALTSPADDAAGLVTSSAERRTANDDARRAWRHTLPWAGAAAVVGAAAVLSLWAPWRAQAPMDRPLVRLDVDLGANVSLPEPNAVVSNVAISPDGTRLVFASGRPTKLFTRRLDQPQATELPGTEGAQGPFFSPDGRWIAFVARGKLSKISVDGGAAVLVGDAENFVGASWSEDGSIILGGGPWSRGLLRIPADGGVPETILPLSNGEAALARPQALPGARRSCLRRRPPQRGTWVGSTWRCSRWPIAIERSWPVADQQRGICRRPPARPSGLHQQRHVVRRSLDLQKLETRGTAIPVLDDVGIPSRSAPVVWMSPAPALWSTAGPARPSPARVRRCNGSMPPGGRNRCAPYPASIRNHGYPRMVRESRCCLAKADSGMCGSTTRSGTP
jgi:serine/threonine-protein kinase